jgi:hypothetical protein
MIKGLVPKATYYGRVGLELGKLIAHQRSMQPPYASHKPGLAHWNIGIITNGS